MAAPKTNQLSNQILVTGFFGDPPEYVAALDLPSIKRVPTVFY